LAGASLGQGWKKGLAEERFMLFTMIPLGFAVFGSLISSNCIKKGRRGPKMMFDIIGIIGCSLAITNSYLLMLIGKCILAIAAGAQITIAPRIIEETIPAQYFDKGWGSMTMVGINMIMFVSMIGLETSYGHNTSYKFIYIIPIVLFSVSLIMTKCCLKTEPIGFLLNRNPKRAKRALK